MVEVFLSSTASDLSEHRKAVIAAIRRLDGYHCVCMEEFGARDREADDFCCARVGESDLFVGLIGHFYGSCPEGSSKSFTEREYDKAMEATKPCLMFLAGDDFRIAANLHEPIEKWEAQQAFRKRVSKRICEIFLLPEEIALKVTQAIRNWEQGTLQQGHRLQVGLTPPMPSLIVGREEELREPETSQIAPQITQASRSQLSPEESSRPEERNKSHIVDYVINLPLDMQLTDKELAILRRFADFPRSQYTQAYRLAWIYDELLADIPSGVSHMILENLLEKGHLEKYVTKLGSVYYRVSDGGRKFLVDNELI